MVEPAVTGQHWVTPLLHSGCDSHNLEFASACRQTTWVPPIDLHSVKFAPADPSMIPLVDLVSKSSSIGLALTYGMGSPPIFDWLPTGGICSLLRSVLSWQSPLMEKPEFSF